MHSCGRLGNCVVSGQGEGKDRLLFANQAENLGALAGDRRRGGFVVRDHGRPLCNVARCQAFNLCGVPKKAAIRQLDRAHAHPVAKSAKRDGWGFMARPQFVRGFFGRKFFACAANWRGGVLIHGVAPLNEVQRLFISLYAH